ncbi:MAG: ArsC family (seleno)protein [Thermoanaerobaculia bacterium]|nr:ArsC family (seleno)protein [Thermoanaerobaculia bacterium]
MDAHSLAPKEKVSAARKLGRDQAREILAASKRLVVAKGRKVEGFRPGGEVDEGLVDRMVGSTGNLRAPLVRSGGTTLVGFDEEAWAEVLL